MRLIPFAVSPTLLMLAVATSAQVATTALAQNDLPAAPETRQQPPFESQATGTDSGGIFQRDHLLGDLGGVRKRLEDAGLTITLQETSEILGNVSGGRRTGTDYEGQLLMALDVDGEKAFDLPGASFRASAFQIHGRGMSSDDIRNLNIVSGIEATRSTRLFELWYEQKLFDDVVAIRIGQQSADTEFMVSTYSALFINASFGWPTLPAVDLPSGGPAYPLATPAVRLKVQPRDDLTVLLGVFSGDPAPAGSGDPQLRDASGTSFTLNRGVFVIGEVQYSLNGGKDDTGLPGTYKVGAWYNSNGGADQRYSYDGLSLANPASSGIPRQLVNDVSVYATADQLVWREPGTKDQGIGVFARISGAGDDRNLIALGFTTGVTWKGIIPTRNTDTLGLAFSYAQIGARARGLDRDQSFFNGVAYPVRSAESVLELTYQAPVTPWLTLQPDFQYVFKPAGGVPNPDNPARQLGDAAIFGLRGVVVF